MAVITVQLIHNNKMYTGTPMGQVRWLCRYAMTQLTYKNANDEERIKQLLNAKVEESRIQKLSRTQFENLPEPVQEKLNASA
jgi:hypothetical protein